MADPLDAAPADTPTPAPARRASDFEPGDPLAGRTEVLPPEELARLRRVPTERVPAAPALPGDTPASDSTIGRQTRFSGPSPVRDPRDDEGEPFGRYRLLAKLGEGGMGVVWKAWDVQLRRIVALKQVLPDDSGSASPERFLREAQIAARLRHPRIVAIHDVGTHEGRPYFTCDYVEGEAVSEKLRHRVARDQVLAWVGDVAGALHYAHEQGIVHRDVKPDNLLIDGQGRAFVTDFGLAREVDLGASDPMGRLTVSGAIVGTPRYMSPEQASGDRTRLGPASDQFSLGVVLYELLVGRPPFEGETFRDLLNATAEAEPARPRSIDPRIELDLETVCLKALEKDPARRYASVGEMAADLERVRRGEPIRARPLSLAGRMARLAARRRSALVPAAVAVGVLLALGAWGAIAHVREKARLEAELERARQEEVAARERAQRDLAEALALLEQGRPALDRAARLAYQRNATPAEYVRRVEAARKLIEQAVAKAPHLASARYLLGVAWDLEGWEDRAEAAWREALARDPGFGPAHFRLGRLLLVRVFLKMVYVDTAAARGAAQRAARRRAVEPALEEAARAFEAAFRGEALSGFEEEARHGQDLAQAWRAAVEDRLDDVIRVCGEAIARAPEAEGSEEFHWLLAQTGEDPRQMLARLDQALAIRPGFPLARLTRAGERAARGDAAGALDDYAVALAFRPRFVEARVNRAVLYGLMDRLDESLVDFEAALALDPQYVPARAGRGSSCYRLHRLVEAEADLTAALALDPDLPGIWTNRGNVRYARGEVAAARADWDEALKRDPAHLEALGNMALAHLEQGEAEASIATHEELLRVAPPVWPHREEVELRIGYARDLAAQVEQWKLPPWAGAALGASFAWQFGDYAVARRVYEQALAEAGPEAGGQANTRPVVTHAHLFLARMYALLAAGRLTPTKPLPEDAPEAGKGAECRDRAFAHLEAAFQLDPVATKGLLKHEHLAALQADPRWAEWGKR